MLHFRAGTAADQPAIAEMVREIWGGEDYLAKVWAEWVVAPRSQLIVGTLDDELVATGRIVELVPGGWWLEGLRVHPQRQGQGLARLLHEQLVALALRQPGVREVGLATSDDTVKIAHLATQSGMAQQGRYRYLRGEPLAGPPAGGLALAAPQQEVESLLARLHAGAWLRASSGYAMEGWVTRPLDHAWLAELWSAGGVWRCGEALALLGRGSHHDQAWLYALDGGDGEAQAALLGHARRWAGTLGQPLRCFVPDDEWLQRPLLAAGLRDPYDGQPFHLLHFAMAAPPRTDAAP